MHYTIGPGLYHCGNPGPESPVLVSANYRLSFNVLRRNLTGLDIWILVLDTKGINVWCAAGKGTFGTAALVNGIGKAGLADVVTHRTVVLPQLGAPGISAHAVKEQCRFKVEFGPVRATDIPRFLENSYQADRTMRTVTFTLRERFVLVPMELSFLPRKLALWVGLTALALGLGPQGFLVTPLLHDGFPVLIHLLGSVAAGAVVVPLLLPFLPGRSFAIKGALAGALIFWALYSLTPALSPALAFGTGVFCTTFSSYLGLNFTGSTPLTNRTGVKREMRFAVPAYITGAVVSCAALVLHIVNQWGQR